MNKYHIEVLGVARGKSFKLKEDSFKLDTKEKSFYQPFYEFPIPLSSGGGEGMLELRRREEGFKLKRREGVFAATE